MTVRAALAGDVPALVELINRAYRVEEFFVSGDRTDAADIRARMARPGAAFLMIEEGGQVLGTVFAEVSGNGGFFAMLAVDPSHQKKGLGRQLIEAVEAHCRDAGCRTLGMDIVNLRHELPPFYQKFGFVPWGTAPFHDPGKLTQPAHLVLMRKVL